MIAIPLYSLLVAYAIFLIVFFVFFIINLLHIILTGTTTFTSFVATFAIIALTVLTVFGTWHLLQNIDWQQTLTVFDASWIKSLFKSGNIQYF